jgi:hypothetical protein
MSPSESPDPADSAAMGSYAVLMRVHAPLLDSLFWLALGCVLGWQDKECVVCMNKRDDEHDRSHAPQYQWAHHHSRPWHPRRAASGRCTAASEGRQDRVSLRAWGR